MKLLVTIFLIILVVSCDYRTSSKKRFEKACDIEIPKEHEVLKDEYEDMLQDYSIQYELRFNKRNIDDLIRSIESSRFYGSQNKASIPGWKRTINGYSFKSAANSTYYTAELDINTRSLKLEESSD